MAKITKISQRTASTPSLTAILAEYGELKWSITVGKKPRGMWRPNIRVEFHSVKNTLNIDPDIHARDLFPEAPQEWLSCGSCAICKEAADEYFPAMYKKSCGRDSTTAVCKFRSFLNDVHFERGKLFEFYPEWRPGIPDYSDIVEWLRGKVCEPIVRIYNERMMEAWQSLPSEEFTVTAETVNAEAQREELAKKPSRKVRIA